MADNREKLNERAYHLWKESGGEHGRDMEHWLRAEQELTDKPAVKTATKKAAAPKKAAETKTASPSPAKTASAPGKAKAEKKPAAPAAKKAAPARKPKSPA